MSILSKNYTENLQDDLEETNVFSHWKDEDNKKEISFFSRWKDEEQEEKTKSDDDFEPVIKRFRG